MEKEDCLSQTKQSHYRILKKIYERPDKKSSYYLAEDSKWQRLVGIKKIQKTNNKKQQEQIKLLMKVSESTPFVPRVYEVLEDNENSYIIMEHIIGNTLEQLIKNEPSKVKKVHPIIMRKIIDLLRHLPYEHRDIKPANIIIREQILNSNYSSIDVFLIDFGLSALFPFANEGTKYYQAPEQKQETEISIKANAYKQIDIYACGMMLLEMLLGTKPIEGKNYSPYESPEEWTVFEELRTNGILEQEITFIQKCVQPNPPKRIKTIKEMSYVYNKN